MGCYRVRTINNFRKMKQLEAAEKHLNNAKQYIEEILKDIKEK